MKIYITGVSGTGKTCIAGALAARGVNAVDTDELSHWEDKRTGERTGLEPGGSEEWYDSHAWVCDVSQLEKILSKAEHAVAIGHASNQDEYLGLFDKKFILACSSETVTARIMQRTNNDFGKHPSDLKRVLSWQKELEAEMVGKGALLLDAERPLEEVVNEIESNLK